MEFVDAAGDPWADESGRIVSDPGHSLEFVGPVPEVQPGGAALWRRHAGAAGGAPGHRADHACIAGPRLRERFPPAVGGICKTVDLLTRRPVDDTMPWWSLPETIRAALAAWRVVKSDESRQTCLDILARSHNAFVTHYVRPQTYLMAVKVRDARGAVLDLMPSYPDADPGYHTALSLIDALDL